MRSPVGAAAAPAPRHQPSSAGGSLQLCSPLLDGWQLGSRKEALSGPVRPSGPRVGLSVPLRHRARRPRPSPLSVFRLASGTLLAVARPRLPAMVGGFLSVLPLPSARPAGMLRPPPSLSSLPGTTGPGLNRGHPSRSQRSKKQEERALSEGNNRRRPHYLAVPPLLPLVVSSCSLMASAADSVGRFLAAGSSVSLRAESK